MTDQEKKRLFMAGYWGATRDMYGSLDETSSVDTSLRHVLTMEANKAYDDFIKEGVMTHPNDFVEEYIAGGRKVLDALRELAKEYSDAHPPLISLIVGLMRQVDTHMEAYTYAINSRRKDDE